MFVKSISSSNASAANTDGCELSRFLSVPLRGPLVRRTAAEAEIIDLDFSCRLL
jgi:hypothetical protein